MLAFQPKFTSFDESIIFLGVPSGLELSHEILPLKPTTFATNSVNSRIEISSPVPILMCETVFETCLVNIFSSKLILFAEYFFGKHHKIIKIT